MKTTLKKKITMAQTMAGRLVGLRQLVVLVDMVVGVGVVTAGGDRVAVVVGVREGICRRCRWQGITHQSGV